MSRRAKKGKPPRNWDEEHEIAELAQLSRPTRPLGDEATG